MIFPQGLDDSVLLSCEDRIDDLVWKSVTIYTLRQRCLEHFRNAHLIYYLLMLLFLHFNVIPTPCSWCGLLKAFKHPSSAWRFVNSSVFEILFTSRYYQTRLKILDLETLEHPGMKFDLILCYQIVRHFSDIPFDNIFSFVEELERRTYRYQLVRRTGSINSAFYSSESDYSDLAVSFRM